MLATILLPVRPLLDDKRSRLCSVQTRRGTDWTRAFAVVNYEQAVEPFLKTDRLSDSERAMLMGGGLRQGLWLAAKERLVVSV